MAFADNVVLEAVRAPAAGSGPGGGVARVRHSSRLAAHADVRGPRRDVSPRETQLHHGVPAPHWASWPCCTGGAATGIGSASASPCRPSRCWRGNTTALNAEGGRRHSGALARDRVLRADRFRDARLAPRRHGAVPHGCGGLLPVGACGPPCADRLGHVSCRGRPSVICWPKAAAPGDGNFLWSGQLAAFVLFAASAVAVLRAAATGRRGCEPARAGLRCAEASSSGTSASGIQHLYATWLA